MKRITLILTFFILFLGSKNAGARIISNNACTATCFPYTFITNANVVPCERYYLQVDGFAGSKCKLTIFADKEQFLTDTLESQIVFSKNKFCAGETGVFTASISGIDNCKPASWKWTVEPTGYATITPISIGNVIKSSATINFNKQLPEGSKLCIKATPTFSAASECLPYVKPLCFEAEIVNVPNITCDLTYCKNGLPSELNIIDCIKKQYPNFNEKIVLNDIISIDSIDFPVGKITSKTYEYKVDGVSCVGNIKLNVNVQRPVEKEIAPILLYKGEKINFKGAVFSYDDYYGVKFLKSRYKPFQNIGFPGGCDTTYIITVGKIFLKSKVIGINTFDCNTTMVTLDGSSSITLPETGKIDYGIGEGFRSYQWYQKTSSGWEIIVGATDVLFKPSNKGTYKLRLIYKYTFSTFSGIKTTKVCIDDSDEIIVGDLPSLYKEITVLESELPYNYDIKKDLIQQFPLFTDSITQNRVIKIDSGVFGVGKSTTKEFSYFINGAKCSGRVILTVNVMPSNTLSFDIADMPCAYKGDTVDIPVRVKNFNKVKFFNLKVMVKDTNVAKLVDVVGYGLPWVSNNIENSKTFLFWFSQFGDAVRLPYDTVAFYLRIKLVGENSNIKTPIEFVNDIIYPFEATVIQDSMEKRIIPYTSDGSACITNFYPNICGKVKREDNIGIANTTVKLSNYRGYTKTTTTDNLGNYCFTAVPAISDSIIIEVQKLDNPKNGVTSGDLFRVQSHILGSSLLDTKYKMLAADVNNSSSIASSDLFRIQQLILGKIAKFNDVNSWEFVPANYSLGTNPFSPVAPKKLVVSASQNINNADFIGYKMGDVNNSNTPTANPVSNTRAAKEVVFKASSQTTDVGKEIDVKVSASSFSQMIATQFSMKWDSSVLQFKSLGGFNSAMLLENANFTTDEVTSGRLGFLWFDEKAKTVTLPNDATIFTIKFKVIGGEKTNSIVSFDSIPVGISSENIDETLITVFEKGTIQVNAIIDTKDNVANQVAIKVYPNPVNHVLNVDLSSVSSAQITVELLDASGKQLRKMEGLPSNKIATIDMSDLPNQVYFLKVKSNNELLHIEKVIKE